MMDVLEIQQILADNNYDRKQLMSILHAIQHQCGHLPEYALSVIAEQLDVPLAELKGVVQFYKAFTLKPKGKYKIEVCNGTSCHLNDRGKLLAKVKELLGIEIDETTADEMFTLETVRCLGCCSLPPTMKINDDTFSSVNDEKAAAIIERCKENGSKPE